MIFLELDTHVQSLVVYEALASETRLEIINLLGEKKSLNMTEIAQHLKLSNPIITRHIQKLYAANLIRIQKKPGLSGIQKIVKLNVDDIHISFPSTVYPEFHMYNSNIKIGLYSDYHIKPTCGLASENGKIGKFDEPKYFSDNNRISASLLWFSEGFIEYKIPNPLANGENPEILELSLEMASEFQFSNNHWPSDVTITINGVEIGTYTVPGNNSDVRGKLTPLWWENNLSQYGLLKYFRINQMKSEVNGNFLKNITINDLNLQSSSVITVRFSIKEDAKHPGGLTIFGSKFGNHPQDIIMKLYYSIPQN